MRRVVPFRFQTAFLSESVAVVVKGVAECFYLVHVEMKQKHPVLVLVMGLMTWFGHRMEHSQMKNHLPCFGRSKKNFCQRRKFCFVKVG